MGRARAGAAPRDLRRAGTPVRRCRPWAWGGLALAPYVIAEGVQGRHRWILDPFRFLAGALALPPIPIPDPTTANGRRVMEIHVDGDGFVSVAELPDRPFAGEVIRRDVLARYGFPTTVSIIEEIGPTGLYPDKSPALEEIARRIFARPEVEIASHTFSHPFDWLRAEGPAPPTDDATAKTRATAIACPSRATPIRSSARLTAPSLTSTAAWRRPGRRRGSSSGAATRFRPTRPSNERRRWQSRT